MKRNFRVLGIDPGSRVTGWGVIEVNGSDLKYLGSGEIELEDDDYFLRLARIYRGLSEVIENWAPEICVLEEVFVGKNWRSALKLGQARGVALLAALHGGLSVFEFSPREVKLAVTGSGRADKVQVGAMVRVILGLGGYEFGTDESDALAVAICGAFRVEGGVVR